MSVEKVLIQSREGVALVLAEILNYGEMFSNNPTFDGTNPVVWHFENVAFKTRHSLLAVAKKILDHVDGADYYMGMEKVWNPNHNTTYRDTIGEFGNPDACVRLVIKDALGELNEVEITAFGSIRVACNFPPLKRDAETDQLIPPIGSNPFGNSL